MPESIPALAISQWESQMLIKGQKNCDYFNSTHTQDELLNAGYYDGVRVFQAIAEYTKDSKWLQCADHAKQVYRDAYVLANNGAVPGYWNFSDGLLADFQRTGDTKSKDAISLLSTNAAFSADTTPAAWTAGAETQREVALAITTYLNAETAGLGSRDRLKLLADQALGHLDQLYINKSYRCTSVQFCPLEAVGKYHIKPFMSGLEMRALIRYYDKSKDPRVLPAVKASVDWLWSNAWVAADSSFWYENWADDPTKPFTVQPGAPDLNLLIAPAFAWVYSMTGETKYRDAGDQVFNGGVAKAFLDNGKQFNQNYLWSFDYVKWRSGAVSSPSPVPSPSPTPTPVPTPAPCTMTVAVPTLSAWSSGKIVVTFEGLTQSGTVRVTANSGQIVVDPTPKPVSGTSAIVEFAIQVKKKSSSVTVTGPCGTKVVQVTVQ
jgi:hypothetical protein